MARINFTETQRSGTPQGLDQIKDGRSRAKTSAPKSLDAGQPRLQNVDKPDPALLLD